MQVIAHGEHRTSGDVNLARCYLAYAAILSRDSGEAVKRAQMWLKRQVRHNPMPSEVADVIAADVLSLSVSTARLTEDNKRLRTALEDLIAWCPDYADDGVHESLMRAHEALRLSPTARPAEGKTDV